MVEVHAEGMGKDAELLCSLHPPTLPPRASICSLTQQLFEPVLFGFLWRLHYKGIIGQITSHWWLIQSPAPCPNLEIREWN